MQLTLRRIFNNGHETIGQLYVNDVFECYTLEDEPRKVKVYGETRIPAGKYVITPRRVGRILASLNRLWPTTVKYSLWIRNVYNFEYILIHPGTTDKDTYGCLLTGDRYIEKGGRYALRDSRAAYIDLHKKVAPILDKGGVVTIEIFDEEA